MMVLNLAVVRTRVKDGYLENMAIYPGSAAALGGEMNCGKGFDVRLGNPEISD